MIVENKKIWDEIFQKQPPVNNDDDCCVMCEGENGEYVPATHLVLMTSRKHLML